MPRMEAPARAFAIMRPRRKQGRQPDHDRVASLVEQRMVDAIADPQADASRRPGIDFENAIGGGARGDDFFRQGLSVFGEPDHLAGAADEDHVEGQISVFHPHHHRSLGREGEQHATLLREKPAEHEAAFALLLAPHYFYGKFMGSAGGDDLKPFEAALRRRCVDGERYRTRPKKNQACPQSKEGQNSAHQTGRAGGWLLIAIRYGYLG
jgi:hypothetical protein